MLKNLLPALFFAFATACHAPSSVSTPKPYGVWTDAKHFGGVVLGHYESLHIHDNGEVTYRTGGRHITYIYSGHMQFNDDGYVDVSFHTVNVESGLDQIFEQLALESGNKADLPQRKIALDYQSKMRWAIDGGGWLMFKHNLFSSRDFDRLFDDTDDPLDEHYNRINLSLYKPCP